MKRSGLAILAVLAFSQPAPAEDLLDWLQNKTSEAYESAKPNKPVADNAQLVTLEPGEVEMYPRISPDGKSMLVLSGKRREYKVTRRLVENGDPLNVVMDSDVLALSSFAWRGNEYVSFLSFRAGTLGVWEKPVSGQGALRRLHRLIGDFAQPVILNDGSLIAVRLLSHSERSSTMSSRDNFVDWEAKNMQAQLVHITPEGVESELTAGINPALSPDGKQVAFSMKAGRSQHLFAMNVDGSDLVQLTDERSIDVQPAWSPDGRWIVFTSNRGEEKDMRKPRNSDWNIWAIDRDGRNLTQLTNDAGRDGAPAVGADGMVYFHSDRKVGSGEREEHQVRGGVSGFHIWRVSLPTGPY